MITAKLAEAGCFSKIVTLHHVPIGASIGYGIHEFLAQEALLLDHQQYADWATLLARDVGYRCPSRLFSQTADTDQRDADTMQTYNREFLLARAKKPAEPPETPCSLKSVRRLITNVIISSGESSKEYAVNSYVLVAGASGMCSGLPLMTVERRDVIRSCSYTYQIARREVSFSMSSPDMLRVAHIV
jgi:hypothetical protein